MEGQRVLARLLQSLELGNKGIAVLFQGQLLPEPSLPFDFYLEVFHRHVNGLAIFIHDSGPDGERLVGGQETTVRLIEVHRHIGKEDVAELGSPFPLQNHLPGAGPGLGVPHPPYLVVYTIALPTDALLIPAQRRSPCCPILSRPVDRGCQLRVFFGRYGEKDLKITIVDLVFEDLGRVHGQRGRGRGTEQF
ncbi:MAG TPA: hypothetical protein EYH32_07945 [Anaerolineae bacterium]|nr:hypothetical protein [Anaerolineae bacterium]